MDGACWIWKRDAISYYTENDQDYDRVLDIFVRANEGLFPRRSYGRLTLKQLRAGAYAGDALWARRH